MGTPKPVRRLGRERCCGRNSQTLSSTVGNPSFCTVKFIDVIDIHPLFIRVTSCKEACNQLSISHDGVLKDDRLLLLYDLIRSNTLNQPSDSFCDLKVPMK